MLPEDFISLARHDLRQNGSKPSQVALRRALSAVYYAMFHTLAKTGADLLIGESGVSCNKRAWQRIYRGLDHGQTKAACRNQDMMSQFPLPIRKFGSLFIKMQRIRHSADYDPHAEFGEPLTKYMVEGSINDVEQTMEDFNTANEKERKDFSSYVLFKGRNPS